MKKSQAEKESTKSSTSTSSNLKEIPDKTLVDNISNTITGLGGSKLALYYYPKENLNT